MKHLIIYIAIGWFALISHSAAAQSPEYLQMVDSSAVATARGDLDKAEFFLRSAMRMEPSNPGNVMLLSNLGLIQYRNGKPEQAIETLTSAHAMAPRAVVVLDNRAGVYAALGRDKEALNDYADILRLDSLNASALFNHAMLSLKENDLPTAREELERLHGAYPLQRNTLMGMASLRMAEARYTDAIPFFDTLIERYGSEKTEAESETTAHYYYCRAYCRLLNEQLSECFADINKAIALDPANPDNYELRAALHRLSYRNDEAEADMKKAKELRH